ncbi:hypothetical protein HDU76_011957, partial [Blyttiomyces sp. JEL0837]
IAKTTKTAAASTSATATRTATRGKPTSAEPPALAKQAAASSSKGTNPKSTKPPTAAQGQKHTISDDESGIAAKVKKVKTKRIIGAFTDDEDNEGDLLKKGRGKVVNEDDDNDDDSDHKKGGDNDDEDEDEDVVMEEAIEKTSVAEKRRDRLQKTATPSTYIYTIPDFATATLEECSTVPAKPAQMPFDSIPYGKRAFVLESTQTTEKSSINQYYVALNIQELSAEGVPAFQTGGEAITRKHFCCVYCLADFWN